MTYLLSLPPEQRPAAIGQLGVEEGDALDLDWPSWAHEGQQPPATCPDGAPWRTWVIMAGRGFGKTLAGAKWITAQIETEEKFEIALVGATLDEARRVMVEGRSGLLNVADAWIRDWQPSPRRLTFRTGAVATLFSGASPEQLRGPEHHLAWCDELAKWEKPRETWDMLLFGLRLGDWPRAIVTTTPRPGPVLSGIIAEPDTVQTGGPTSANPHTAEAWRESTRRLYAGTRLGAQELEGKLLPDVPGALWSVELLERCRVRHGRTTNPVRPEPVEGLSWSLAEEGQGRASTSSARTDEGSGAPDRSTAFTKLVIAVDPPAGDGTCGIVACAKDSGGRAHILADHSVTAMSPEGWSKAVADAVQLWTLAPPPDGEGDHPKGGGGGPALIPLVVAEKNQGGAMVKAVLHTADPTLKVTLVTATVGKAERAAPVAMLFEAGKVVLHGRFPDLEAEMLGMIAGGDYEGPGHSPDRADAMVWGLTELMLQPGKAPPRVRSF